MTKNAYLPKITILLQFGDEILALSCSNDSIQILGSNPLEPRQNYKDLFGVTGARKDQYLTPKLQYDSDFWQVGIFRHALSEYLSQSHNFKKNHFCDVITSVFYSRFSCDVIVFQN